jgi:hypothetical protein
MTGKLESRFQPVNANVDSKCMLVSTSWSEALPAFYSIWPRTVLETSAGFRHYLQARTNQGRAVNEYVR